MSKAELYAAIRRGARAGMSSRALECKYSVGRRTVVEALASAWPQPRKKLPPRPSKLDPFKPVIDGILLPGRCVPFLGDRLPVRHVRVNLTPEQQRLAGQMIRYWTRFAATGDPNARGLPHWSTFRGANVQSLAPNDIRQVNLHTEHNCGF